MIKKFLHIGIGRCSNITLINHIYPIIAQNSNYKFYTSDELIQNEINLNYEKMKLGIKLSENIEIDKDLIVSDERLIGWNPFDWEKYADANLKMFGQDTTVLIILRSPQEYLNSMYKNQCLVSGNLMTPDEYFALNQNYNRDDKHVFNLDLFSYKKLKHIYEDRFDKVIFIDYRNVKNMFFFKNYFKLNEEIQNKLVDEYNNSEPNKSFRTELTNNLTLKLYRVLRIISLVFNLDIIVKIFKYFKIKSNKKNIKNEKLLNLTLNQIRQMNKDDVKLNFYRSFLSIIKWSKLMFILEKNLSNNKKFKIQLKGKKNEIIQSCEKEYLDIISK